jgi:hypothetical protein
MRWRFLPMSFMFGLAFMAAPLAAEDKKPDDQADLPGAFHPYVLNGPHEGQFHCVVCDHGLFPGAIVFVRGTDLSDETSKLLKGLNSIAKGNEKARFAIFAVFLDPDLSTSLTGDNKTDDRRQEIADKLRPIQKQDPELDHVIFALEAEKNLKDYKLGEKDAVTVVLFSKIKVVERFAFENLDAKGREAVFAATREKLVPQKKK